MNSTKIYFICPNTRHPSGGIKQIFQMVDHLNELGYEAYIVRKNRYRPITWFEYNTKIKYFPYLFFLIKNLCVKGKEKSNIKFRFLDFLRFNKKLPEKNSIIVFPEIYGSKINTVLTNRYVVFNQNCFLTFNLFDYDKYSDVYSSERMLAGITVSDNSLEYLKYTFPQANFYKIRLGLSPTFILGDQKRKRIAYMPRKLSTDSNQVLNILKQRGILADWEIVKIDNLPQDKVATILLDCTIFLSFNHQEGFGLPPAEAMAAGCYVVGYAGFGGLEYFNPGFSSLIVDGDIISYVKEVERIINLYNENPKRILEMGKEASNYVRKVYSLENEKQDTKIIWNHIMSGIKD